MELRRLHVAGYRSLRDVTLDLGTVTVLVGPNGAGKSNLYRALRLAHCCAEGTVARAVAHEGGMPSIVWAGERTGEPVVDLSVEAGSLEYHVRLATAGRGASRGGGMSFPLDPVVTRERILAAGPDGPTTDLLERTGSTAIVRDDTGARVTHAFSFHPSESALSQLVDAKRYPDLVGLRGALRSMRFHHQVRADDDAPARRPSVGTRTLAVADDGSDLAAAIATIQRDGDRAALDRCVAAAFGGASIDVAQDGRGRLELALDTGLTRPLSAPELSDGQLRLLFLAAALLSPRPPGVVVLNEPEASLHTDQLPALAALVASATGPTQVVLATHAQQLADMVLSAPGSLGHRVALVDGETSLSPL